MTDLLGRRRSLSTYRLSMSGLVSIRDANPVELNHLVEGWWE
jgi:hypothetical protein